MSEIPLFYDGILDAINKTVNSNPKGLSIKQIAMDLWPSRNPDTARSVLSRALNEETDVHLNPEEMVRIMKITECPEHIIFYLCDEFGFERPTRKNPENFKKEIKQDLKTLMEQLKALTRKVETLEKS
jgi:hypothetical protein